ncbi:uncharacterized protein LOC123296372 [Chrysoperla carnea]|uniref:uncharacterized protein LOC123296372 n=1 Tax=Chrysoperla carnea TaxID=189513 RepID=UPI001D06BAC5|nr:uncharacterized protein LOC123296372 [Chrysoperla carnea]
MIDNRSSIIINDNDNDNIITTTTTRTSILEQQESYPSHTYDDTGSATGIVTGTSHTQYNGVYVEWEQTSNNHNLNDFGGTNNNNNNNNNMKTEVILREDLTGHNSVGGVSVGGSGSGSNNGGVFVPSSSAAKTSLSTLITTNNNNNNNNTITPVFTTLQEHPVIIVRAEEVLLVVLVLMIWVAAIALFFNRWGKIRMLEPYQPKFEQQAAAGGPGGAGHRSSCPIGTGIDSAVNTGCSISDLRKQRMSFSKFNVNCLGDPLYTGLVSPRPTQRLRQNSVFVGSPTMTFLNPPPRRVKSATDIHQLIIGGGALASRGGASVSARLPRKSLSGFSSIALETSPSKEFILKDRRPSITIERPPLFNTPSSASTGTTTGSGTAAAATRRRPSTYHEFSCYFPIPRRRPSCFSDYKPTIAYGRVSKFKSFDQPSCSWERSDRRLSTAFERSPTNVSKRSRPSISLERPISWDRRPSVTIEPPPTSTDHINSNSTSTPLTTKTNTVVIATTDDQKPKLQKQTTINFENINPAHISLNKNSISLDQATSQARVSYDRRPSFTLEQQTSGTPSSAAHLMSEATTGQLSVTGGKHRLSVSLDQAASKWIGTTPTFMIERATPVSPHPPTTILSSSIELQLFESETESKQITNV